MDSRTESIGVRAVFRVAVSSTVVLFLDFSTLMMSISKVRGEGTDAMLLVFPTREGKLAKGKGKFVVVPDLSKIVCSFLCRFSATLLKTSSYTESIFERMT